MKFLLAKKPDGSWIPAYEEDEQKAFLLPAGSIIEAETKEKRNVKLHRKFFKLVHLVYENQERYKSEAELRARLMISVGAVNMYYTETGEAIFVPWSISFNSMDDYSFRDLYPKLVDACIKIIPVDKNELIEYIALNY